MSIFELQELAAERPRVEARHGGALGRLLMSVKRWHCRRQTLVQLSGLSERQLADVGVAPTDVPRQNASMWAKPHSRPDIR